MVKAKRIIKAGARNVRPAFFPVNEDNIPFIKIYFLLTSNVPRRLEINPDLRGMFKIETTSCTSYLAGKPRDAL